MRQTWILLTLLATGLGVHAQWAQYRDPATPRTKDGKPNLSAPAPRVGGKPDLTGVWMAESAPVEEVKQFLLPGGINGLGEDIPSKYFFNFFADYPMGQEPMQPAVAAMYKKMAQNPPAPPTLCPPPTLPLENVVPTVYKIVQAPRVTLFLYESDTVFRQVFTDGRRLPADPQPSWMGSSIGRWDGDTFVVETAGFNDKGPLDVMGHPRSEAMRLTERLLRRDFGHIDVQVTMDDPKTYTKPVTIKLGHRLVPDTDLIETFCAPGETDLAHMRAR